MTRIREASYGELPRVANILARAFWDDNLFGGLIHPKRTEFPETMELYWLRRIRVDFWDYRQRFLVATEEDETGKDVVVAFAQWARLGEGAKKMDCWWFDPRRW